MKVYNNTSFNKEAVHKFDLIKRGKNFWRGRSVLLFAHPEDEDRVISVGVTFDGSMMVIADEAKSDWDRELSMNGDFVTH